MMFRLAMLALTLIPAVSAQSWKIQYFYDHDRERLDIVDLAFPSAQRGIALGAIYREDSGKDPKPVSLTTNDGGANWTLAPLKEQPRSLFFLNDSLGWLVTDRGIWRSEEGGRSWTKINNQKKGLILRVWFLDPQRGFAVGYEKTALTTQDGGRTWTPFAHSTQVVSNPDYTVYTQIAFSDARLGLIVGSVFPPRPGEVPAWLAPQRAVSRRPTPTLLLELETKDGGATWGGSSAQLVGVVKTLRMAGLQGLLVFEFDQSVEFLSEVYSVDFTTGKSTSVFRQPMSRIGDAILFPGHVAFLAGVESPGRLATLPIPGKIKILTSGDLTNWKQMEVDYKAVAGSIVLAGPDADHLWAATDTGMILHMVP